MNRPEPVIPGGAAWTETDARQAARAMLAQVGLTAADLTLLRFGNNGVFRVNEQFAIRVARPTTPAAITRSEVRVAEALQAADVPVVHLAALSVPQPLGAEGCLGTVWDYVHGEPPNYRQLGELVRRFHDRTDSLTIELPQWQPLASARRRLNELSAGYPADDVALLNDWYERISAELDGLRYVLPRGVIHGQAEIGNALLQGATPVFVDLERVCVGPREWDLIDTAAVTLRFDRPLANHQAFAEAYGFDVMAWPGFDALRRVWELRATTWLMQAASHSLDRADEARTRIDSWRQDKPMTAWREV